MMRRDAETGAASHQNPTEAKRVRAASKDDGAWTKQLMCVEIIAHDNRTLLILASARNDIRTTATTLSEHKRDTKEAL